MQKKNKMVLKIVSLSLLVLVQTDALARNRGNGSNVYGEMISIEKNMTREMRGQNLSNTYSGKLESNLQELDGSLRQAANLSRSGRGSKRGSIRGGNIVESDDEGLELLVKVSYEALDVLKDLPAAAQENIQEAIESADSNWDDELVEQAEEVLDELGDILGSDSNLRSNPSYGRTDSPARRKMFEQRHRSKKNYAQRKADRDRRKKNKDKKRSSRSPNAYGASNYRGSYQPKQTRAERQNASKGRNRVTQQDEDKAFASLRNHEAFKIKDSDFNGDSVSPITSAEWAQFRKKKTASSSAGKPTPASEAVEGDLLDLGSLPEGSKATNPFD